MNTKKQSPILFMMIILLSASAFIATDLYLPSFPSLMKHYHVLAGSIQLSLSLFVLSFAVSQFISGVASDRFGRKPILLIGIAIYTIGGILSLLNHSIDCLYLARILQGLGIGAAASISRVLVSDVYDAKNLAKVFSVLSSVIVLMPAVAPFFGGVLQHRFDYYGSFSAMLIFGVVLLAMVIFLLPETNKSLELNALHLRHLTKKIISMLSVRKFSALIFTNGAMFSTVLIYSTISPFVFQTHYGFSAVHYGQILLFIAAGLVVGTLVGRFLMRSFSSSKIVMIGLLGSSLVSFLTLVMSTMHLITPFNLAIQLFLLNITVGMVLPNVVAMIFGCFTHSAGVVGALYGALRMLVASLVGVIISFCHIIHVEQMAVLLLAASLLALACFQLSGASVRRLKLVREV